MSDRYATISRSPLGKRLTSAVGLPQPTALQRWSSSAPAIAGPVLVAAGAPAGEATPLVAAEVARIVSAAGAGVQVLEGDAAAEAARGAAATPAGTWADGTALGGIVVDATGIRSSEELAALHTALHTTVSAVGASGRVLVIGLVPETAPTPSAQIAQRALEGFTRSVGKELGRGRTANLLLLAEGGEAALESTLRFFLSARSAYVSGQVVELGEPAKKAELAPADWRRPLEGKVALVTGAARGIGAAIAQTLHRDGAQIIGLDIPPLADELAATLAPLNGESITLDVTSETAPQELADQIKALHGRVDIVVHNAGITQDRRLIRMKRERWDKVIAVNLIAPQQLTDALLEQKLLGRDSRVINLASIAGIAGNNGQTNYGTSKAGMIGFTEAYAAALAKAGGTINAVAPGFIETKMTAAVPLTIREAGRRMNSLDVAETIAWLASPGSAGINGETVRVCGQSLIGA